MPLIKSTFDYIMGNRGFASLTGIRAPADCPYRTAAATPQRTRGDDWHAPCLEADGS
jgi:hypothetical protein